MASNTSDAMAAFLARGGAITKCAPSLKQARSLAAMRRDERLKMEELDSEQEAERSMERFGAARANGASVSDALDESR